MNDYKRYNEILFNKEPCNIKEFNKNIIKNKKITKISNIWYMFYNNIDEKYYISYDKYFIEYFTTYHKPIFFNNNIIINNYDINKSYINCDFDKNFKDTENYYCINGIIKIFDNVIYYVDNDTLEYYICSENSGEFQPILINDDETRIYKNIKFIKTYKYIGEYFLLCEINNNLYISDVDSPNMFYKLTSIPITDKEAREIYYKNKEYC